MRQIELTMASKFWTGTLLSFLGRNFIIADKYGKSNEGEEFIFYLIFILFKICPKKLYLTKKVFIKNLEPSRGPLSFLIVCC